MFPGIGFRSSRNEAAAAPKTDCRPDFGYAGNEAAVYGLSCGSFSFRPRVNDFFDGHPASRFHCATASGWPVTKKQERGERWFIWLIPISFSTTAAPEGARLYAVIVLFCAASSRCTALPRLRSDLNRFIPGGIGHIDSPGKRHN